MTARPYTWHFADRVIHFDERPLVMGIINVTPDSFSDGGRYASTESAVEHGCRLAEEGADILDIGGESSRPGASPVSAGEEIQRVLPVVEALAAKTNVPLCVDTWKAEVARVCLAAGAKIVNDITGLQGDPRMPDLVRDTAAGAVVMHMQGSPATMQKNPHYADVIGDISLFFETRLHELTKVGIRSERLVFDPGVGFGKTVEHNLAIVARLGEFHRMKRPVCLGVSRKGFIGKVLGRPLERRLVGSLALVGYAVSHGTVQIVRVHDVEETCDMVKMLATLRSVAGGPKEC
jgi:dihydropteroate synthase